MKIGTVFFSWYKLKEVKHDKDYLAQWIKVSKGFRNTAYSRPEFISSLT